MAVLVVVPLVTLAIWAAYAWPQTRPAQVPGPGAASPFGTPKGVDRRVVVARLDGVDVLLPVRLEATTAVAFHAVDASGSVAFAPVGDRADASGVSASLADIFNGGGGLRYYQLDGQGSSAPTAGLDVGAVPGVFVYAPVDGKVVSVTDYKLLGRYPDTEIQIQLAGAPSVLLLISHIVNPAVKIGDVVTAGETALGSVRGFPPAVKQELSQVTTDAGDHVQLVALRVTPSLSGL